MPFSEVQHRLAIRFPPFLLSLREYRWAFLRSDLVAGLTVAVVLVPQSMAYAMHPRIVRITKDPSLNMFVNADTYRKPGCPQILELRSDNCIFFGNAEYTVEQMLSRLDEQKTPVKFLLLDFEAIGFVDVSAVDELRTLLEETRAKGIQLAFIFVHLPVRGVLKSTGFLDELAENHIFGARGEAVAYLFEHLDHNYCRDICPHRLFHECSTVK